MGGCQCLDDYPFGYNHCPQTHKLLEEEMVRYDKRGRLVMIDGGELPPPTNSAGGVAEVIRNARKFRTEIKGKAVERDLPPHMASTNLAGLQLDGRDVLTREAFGVEMVEQMPGWRASVCPVERSQKENVRHDLTKRPPTIRIPAKTSIPETLREAKKASEKERSGLDKAQKSMLAKSHEPKDHQHASPPARNTKVGTEKKEKTENGGGRTNPSYHFTSTVQEKVDLDAVELQLLDQTMITMTVGQFLGCSPEFQKRMANMTKTRREYTNKPVMMSHVDNLGEEMCPCGCMELRTAGVEEDEMTEQFVGSKVQMDFDSEVMTQEAIEVRYASAVKLLKNPVPLFAMVTGKFEGMFGGLKTVFMVDTGSELNLCPGYLYDQTQLSLDLDGTRWLLRGIHGDPVRLKGCVRDMSVRIGGHTFDHHFFVNGAVRGSDGVGDVILGQPWLQWYTACLQYDRSGGMTMKVWQDGSRGGRATLSIPITTPNAIRNKDSLEVEGSRGFPKCRHQPTVEDEEDFEAGN